MKEIFIWKPRLEIWCIPSLCGILQIGCSDFPIWPESEQQLVMSTYSRRFFAFYSTICLNVYILTKIGHIFHNSVRFLVSISIS